MYPDPYAPKEKAWDSWSEILEGCGIEILALDLVADEWMFKEMQKQPQWEIDLKEGQTVIFVRTNTDYRNKVNPES